MVTRLGSCCYKRCCIWLPGKRTQRQQAQRPLPDAGTPGGARRVWLGWHFDKALREEAVGEKSLPCLAGFSRVSRAHFPAGPVFLYD